MTGPDTTTTEATEPTVVDLTHGGRAADDRGGHRDAGPITIVPLRRRHLTDVLAIETQVYPRPWTRSLFEGEIDRADRCYVAARSGDRLVGYAGSLLMLDEGHIGTVAVDPRWQGCGVATRLLLEIVRGALDRGATDLTLEVRVSNHRAQALYRRFGFAPAGVRKGYYAETNEDAIVMWAHDADSEAYRARLTVIEDSLPSPTLRVGFEDAVARRHPAGDVSAARPARMEP